MDGVGVVRKRALTILASFLVCSCVSSTTPLLHAELLYPDLTGPIQFTEYRISEGSWVENKKSATLTRNPDLSYNITEYPDDSSKTISFEEIGSGFYLVMEKFGDESAVYFYQLIYKDRGGYNIYEWSLGTHNNSNGLSRELKEGKDSLLFKQCAVEFNKTAIIKTDVVNADIDENTDITFPVRFKLINYAKICAKYILSHHVAPTTKYSRHR